MARSASRARPEGGFWYTATLPALGLSLAKKQEFYISNIKLQARLVFQLSSFLSFKHFQSLQNKVSLTDLDVMNTEKIKSSGFL